MRLICEFATFTLFFELSLTSKIDFKTSEEVRLKLEALKNPFRRVNPEFPPPLMSLEIGNETADKLTIIGNQHRWPNNIVPYDIEPEISASNKELILESMTEVEIHTCVTFPLKLASDTHYIYFRSLGQESCSTHVGYSRNRPVHYINLNADGCMHHQVVIHEVLHALGQYHEQSHPDRDDHLIINWDLIPEGFHNYYKYIELGTSPLPQRCSDLTVLFNIIFVPINSARRLSKVRHHQNWRFRSMASLL